MAALDVEMDVEQENGPVLAEDNPITWAKVADLALRHMARVSRPPTHPSDVALSDNPLSLVREIPVKQPLVNYDAHIPGPVRVPQTWSLVEYAIRTISASLTRRPSDFYAGGTNVWTCPKEDCTYIVHLSHLSEDDLTVLDDATTGIENPFIAWVEGHAAAATASIREVIDILALHHYELTHLHASRIRHVLHGQGHNGRIRYYWEPLEFGDDLINEFARGWEARHHEEHRRLAVQRAMAAEARKWARELIRCADMGDKKARDRTRVGQSEYVRDNFQHLISLDRGDGLFEPRSSLYEGRDAASSVVRTVTAAMDRAHGLGFDTYVDAMRAAARRERLRSMAAAEKEVWATGEGSVRLVKRGNSRQMYL